MIAYCCLVTYVNINNVIRVARFSFLNKHIKTNIFTGDENKITKTIIRVIDLMLK